MQALINYLNHYILALKRFYRWITAQQLVLIPKEEGDMYSIPQFKKRSQRLVELENFSYEWYVWLRPRVKARLKRYWRFISVRIIHNYITRPIQTFCTTVWAFWGWRGEFWSWDFWYNQYYSIRVWITPTLVDHYKDWDETLTKFALFEWQYQVKEQTLNTVNEIYLIPMRPDSFTDFIFLGVVIFLLPASLYSSTLKWYEVLRNIINTTLQIGWIIIITRMVVTVFWSSHLTMYIMFHPICFSLLLLSRSFANDILLDDESITDVVCMWCGYFFLTTILWSIDMFFIH